MQASAPKRKPTSQAPGERVGLRVVLLRLFSAPSGRNILRGWQRPAEPSGRGGVRIACSSIRCAASPCRIVRINTNKMLPAEGDMVNHGKPSKALLSARLHGVGGRISDLNPRTSFFSRSSRDKYSQQVDASERWTEQPCRKTANMAGSLMDVCVP